MAKRGRPSRYSEAVAAEICTRLSEGEALRSICADDHMPAVGTVCLWASEDREGFSERYARALQARAWLWAEEIMDIADTGDDVNRDKLRVDARKWALSRLLPHRYGDRQTLEHTGKDGKPLQVQFIAPDQYAEDEWEQKHLSSE